MKYKIFKTARNQIIKIWQYTEEKWGEKQADKYIHELFKSFKEISSTPHMWRKVSHEKIKDVYYYRYKKHYIFFRKLTSGAIGVISILHERMNIPERLREDFKEF